MLAVAGTGCALLESADPGDAVDVFLRALAEGDTAAAAAVTDAPESAEATLDSVHAALQPEDIGIEIGDSTGGSAAATVSYRLDWQLSDDRTWDYEAEADLFLAGDDEWTIQWTPSVIHPDLAAKQTLAVRTDAPTLAPVLDGDGSTLLEARRVVSINLDPDAAADRPGLRAVAKELSGALRPIDSAITTSAIVEGAADVEDGQTYLVAALRESDHREVESRIEDLAGVSFSHQQRLLAEDKTYAAQVLPAIREHVADEVAGTPGWRVVALDATGAEAAQLHAADPQPGEAVDTTLDKTTQTAAENAADSVDQPVAIVALDAPSGAIRAVAQNAGADRAGAIALTGRYPPGSTFKIATALAGISAGEVSRNSRVACPGSTVIDNRSIPNEGRFHLGKVALSTAFARSCNTSFAELAAELPADALTTAAADLGIGADFVIDPLTTVTGSAPAAEDRVQRAENGFGQGTVLTSPFGMALAAATVRTGETPEPSIIEGQQVESQGLGDELDPSAARQLRAMMRAVVTDGTATDLASLPGVHGKTGTAQHGDGSDAHGWFVGFSGDLAFAVLVVDAGSSRPAVEVTDRFLGQR